MGALPGAGAAVWYVSPSGDDAAAGDEAAPFRNIAKAVQVAQAGDEVILHGGEYGWLQSQRSGIPGQPIVFRARESNGIPERVVLSGFTPVTPGENGYGNWELHAGSIWKIAVPPGVGFNVGANLLSFNGEAMIPARWPNAVHPVDFDRRNMREATDGTLDPDSKGTQEPYGTDLFYTGSYTDAGLVGFDADAWAGAHIDVCAGHNWWHKSGVVTGNAGNEIYFRYRFSENWNPVLDTPKVGDRYALWGHLRALDTPGEFFLDVNGVNGPARTLYVWLPESQSPAGLDLRLLNRSRVLDVGAHTDLRFENLTVKGTVWTSPSSERLHFRGVESRFGGWNRNLLVYSARMAVELRGTDHVFEDGRVSDTWGRALVPIGSGHRVENNVVVNSGSHLLSLAGAQESLIRRNSAWRSGDTAVDIGGKGLLIELNHVSHAGMRITDIALMNTWNAGDLEGTEIRRNWVHDNQAPFDSAKSWWGGQGIRLDSGHAPDGVYNALIHHNVVWATSAESSITMWRLADTSPGFGIAEIRVYQNTVDRSLVLAGSGSDGGITFARNIAAVWNSTHAAIDGAVVSENLFQNSTVAGNLRADPGFVSSINHNLQLREDSVARDHGVPIPGITHQPGPAYLGAYPPEEAPWHPGARVRPRDVPDLRAEWVLDANGRAHVWVREAPAGRGFSEDFRIRLGDAVFSGALFFTDTESRNVEARFELDATSLPSVVSLEYDLGDGSWLTVSGQTELEIPAPGLRMEEVSGIPAEGGVPVSVPAVGLYGEAARRVRLQLSGLLIGDLYGHAIPLMMNTAELLAAGMRADASDLRFYAEDGVTPIAFHVESPPGSSNTLVWLSLTDNDSNPRISYGDFSEIYVSWGDDARVSADDPAVPLGLAPVLASPDLLLHLRATDLVREAGASLESWPDRSLQEHPVLQNDADSQPHYVADSMGGLPAVVFDGMNDHFLVNGAEGLGVGATRAYTVYRNPDPETMKWQRIFSGRASTEVTDWETGVIATPTTDGEGNVIASAAPVVQRSNTFNETKSRQNFTLGRRALVNHEMFRGEIAEILVFKRNLTAEEDPALMAYLNRKYALSPRPSGVLIWEEAQDALQVWVDGRPATEARVGEDGALSFVVPQYTGEGPLPKAVDLRVRLPDGREFLHGEAFIYLPFEAEVHLENLLQVYDGLAKSVTAGTIPPGLTLNVVYENLVAPPTGAGSYEVQVSVVDDLYAGQSVGTLIVQAAPLHLDAVELGKAEGQPDPLLRWEWAGGTLFGADELHGELIRASGEAPGSYVISAGSLDAGPNYILHFQPALFHIHVAGQSTLVHDSLSDGESGIGSDPLDVHWRSSDPGDSLITVVEDPLLDPEEPHQVIDFNITRPWTDGKDDYLYFALPHTVTLAVGQTLRVSYRLRIAGGPPRADASRTGVSLGYRSTGMSPWSHADNAEYFFVTSYGAEGTLGSLRKSRGEQFLNTGVTLRSGARSVNLGNDPGTVLFEVTRLDEQTARLRSQLNGLPYDEVLDAGADFWSFNWVFLRFRNAASESNETFRVDEMRVELLAEGHRPRIFMEEGDWFFPSSAIFRYQLVEAVTLEGDVDWSPVGEAVNGDGTSLILHLPESGPPLRFYRLQVEPIPGL